MKKSVLRWVAVLAVLLPCLLLSAAAAGVVDSGYCGGEGDGTNLTWVLYADGELVISGSGAMEDYWADYWFDPEEEARWGSISTAPWNIGQVRRVNILEGVTTIGDHAFMGEIDGCGEEYVTNSILTEVVIPDSVTHIGYGAFMDCKKLTNATIMGDITSAEQAFRGCSNLATVTLDDGMTCIPEFMFCECTSLTSVDIPDSVTCIDYAAFCDTGLTEVIIPASVSRMDSGAFDSALVKMEFLGASPEIVASVGDVWLPTDAFSGYDDLTIYYHEGTTGWPTTGTWQGRPLVMIPTRVIIASGYCGANLTWILYADGKLVISGNGAMMNWEYEDAPWTPYKKSIETITVEEGVTYITANAFCCPNATRISLPSTLEGLEYEPGVGATINCPNLLTITVDSANERYFDRNGVLFTDNALIQYPSARQGAYTVPDDISYIDYWAFAGSKGLTEVNIPDGVDYIAHGAFEGCASLVKVIIGSGVDSIGVNAFSGCEKLTAIEFLGDVVGEVAASAFDDCEKLTIYYHEGHSSWVEDEWSYDAQTGTWCGRPLEIIYNVENYKPAGKHPEKEDHIFAGWYEDHDHKNPHKNHGGNAHAKFVHKDVFRIKAQVSAGTNAKSEFTDIRFVTTVDCLNYKKVGFKITFGGKTVTQETSTVYSSIVSNTDGVEVDYTPSGEFHEDSKYFVTMVLKDIPNQHFNDTFTVTPYWITQDGSVVEGVTNELRISMGF